MIELFSAEPHPPSEQLMDVMDDLSAQIGRVIERERLMGQMADLVWREQQELLHTLHDSLGQTLTALGMLSSGLSQRLDGVGTDAADTARHVATLAQEALGQVRQLSKGVAPTEIDARGFSQALGQLATATSFVHGVDIDVDGELPESCPTRTTTHLYRIAQEAVTNAVKPARARTIRIEVHAGAGQTSLSIVDDGVGMRAGATKPAGLGIHIMRHRARSIGGQLEIGAGPGGGTRITCTIPLRQLSEVVTGRTAAAPERTMSDSPARIFIVDDHPVVRLGIRPMVSADQRLSICGEADGGEVALSLIEASTPDLVIVDLSLGRGTGLELIRTLHDRHPGLPVLVLEGRHRAPPLRYELGRKTLGMGRLARGNASRRSTK